MSVYVVGDVQGCYRSLQALLAAIDFLPERDRIVFVGDLVNRGPRSLEVLRWVRDHESCCATVLGNHDIHLLALAIGARKPKRNDTLDAVLDAPDCDELIEWLRRRPLLIEESGAVVVHAGLHPRWDVATARALAGEVEHMLRSHHWADKLARCYRRAQDWQDSLGGRRRRAAILSVLVSIRGCTPEGRLHRGFSGPPEHMPAGYVPWFEVPDPAWAGTRVAFGHWATMGARVTDDIIATDSGCVWGGSLTAVRLDDDAVFSVPAAADEHRAPL